MSPVEFHVFTKRGDACGEIEAALRELGMDAPAAGLHRYFFVTRVNQTVALTGDARVPIAALLRDRGWAEPGNAA